MAMPSYNPDDDEIDLSLVEHILVIEGEEVEDEIMEVLDRVSKENLNGKRQSE